MVYLMVYLGEVQRITANCNFIYDHKACLSNTTASVKT